MLLRWRFGQAMRAGSTGIAPQQFLGGPNTRTPKLPNPRTSTRVAVPALAPWLAEGPRENRSGETSMGAPKAPENLDQISINLPEAQPSCEPDLTVVGVPIFSRSILVASASTAIHVPHSPFTKVTNSTGKTQGPRVSSSRRCGFPGRDASFDPCSPQTSVSIAWHSSSA